MPHRILAALLTNRSLEIRPLVQISGISAAIGSVAAIRAETFTAATSFLAATITLGLAAYRQFRQGRRAEDTADELARIECEVVRRQRLRELAGDTASLPTPPIKEPPDATPQA
jgi:hypothetical protein